MPTEGAGNQLAAIFRGAGNGSPDFPQTAASRELRQVGSSLPAFDSRLAGMIKEDRWPNPYSGQPLHR